MARMVLGDNFPMTGHPVETRNTRGGVLIQMALMLGTKLGYLISSCDTHDLEQAWHTGFGGFGTMTSILKVKKILVSSRSCFQRHLEMGQKKAQAPLFSWCLASIVIPVFSWPPESGHSQNETSRCILRPLKRINITGIWPIWPTSKRWPPQKKSGWVHSGWSSTSNFN
jgi:hypothetical protein